MTGNIFLKTYNPLPFTIINSNGCYLIDDRERQFLDMSSGIAVNALGYKHSRILAAVTDQINKFTHLSNNFITGVQIKFTEKLLMHSGMSGAFLTNSGTEATEAALKLVRKKYGSAKKIYSLTNSFHGRTYGALTLSDRIKHKNGFEPFLSNTGKIQFNDLNDLGSKINQDTAAVFVELIQGEGGVFELSQDFVTKLLTLREKFGFIIAADEIQTGIGRTGKPFAFNHYDFLPDIVLCAKAIGGGFPLGAMLVNEKLKKVFTPGSHGSTFGGNPVSCAAGTVVLEEVLEKGLISKVFELGNHLRSGLLKIRESYPVKIKDVRGKGFMIGVELNFPGQLVVDKLLDLKILANCTNENVIRLIPPLIIGRNQIDYFLESFDSVLTEI